MPKRVYCVSIPGVGNYGPYDDEGVARRTASLKRGHTLSRVCPPGYSSYKNVKIYTGERATIEVFELVPVETYHWPEEEVADNRKPLTKMEQELAEAQAKVDALKRKMGR